MPSEKVNDFYFEKNARKDVRIWLAFAIGCIILIVIFDSVFGSDILRSAQGPNWLTAIMFAVGLCMAVVAAMCLIFNTSRGSTVLYDTEELIWWQLKFANQDVSGKNKIGLREVRSIRIDKSNDGLAVSLYDNAGAKQETFSEVILPPDYETWIALLVERWPHIEVELKE